MNARTRRARRLLRSARRGPWGKGRNALSNAMQPVYAEDGTILHYRLVTDPWYTRRRGDLYRPGWFRPPQTWSACLGPKARQRWLKEHEKAARWDVEHALSDCCGWGNDESHGGEPEPYAFITGSVPPRPLSLGPDPWADPEEES